MQASKHGRVTNEAGANATCYALAPASFVTLRPSFAAQTHQPNKHLFEFFGNGAVVIWGDLVD